MRSLLPKSKETNYNPRRPHSERPVVNNELLFEQTSLQIRFACQYVTEFFYVSRISKFCNSCMYDTWKSLKRIVVAMFNRNRNESNFGRQMSGQLSSDHIIIYLSRFYLVFLLQLEWIKSYRVLYINTLSTQLSNVLSNFICFFF